MQLVAGIIDEADEISLSKFVHIDTSKEKHRKEVLAQAFRKINELRDMHETNLGISLKPVNVFSANFKDKSDYDEVLEGYLGLRMQITGMEASEVVSEGESQSSQFSQIIYTASLEVTYLISFATD